MNTIGKFLIIALVCVSAPANSKQLWGDISQSALYGSNYEIGDPSRYVLTTEYAGGHNWGDHFFFLDRIDDGNDSSPDVYTELLLRASGNKLTNYSFEFGFIKDVLLATRLEYSSVTSEQNYLIGLGFDLDIPGLTFFKLNLFHRENEFTDDNVMLNFAWASPFTLGGQKFIYDGFVDWISGVSGQLAPSFNFTSQLKWQINPESKKPIYLGVEYAYWLNKFGIEDTPQFNTDEKNLNLLLKFHF